MTTIGTRLYTLFSGQYVGRDEFGNSYYKQRRPEKGKRTKRWVIYKGLPEPSKVPPHWHGWLHYTTDQFPAEGQVIKQYEWQKEHIPNATATASRHLPAGHALKGGRRASNSADYVAWKPE